MTEAEEKTEAEENAETLMKDLGRLLDARDQNPETPLFHYTSFEGLSGILKTKQFWLTDHKYLNDPSEIEHGKKIILEYIKKNIPNNSNLGEYFKKIIIDIIDNGYKTFITSFCQEGDYLPAWRYYGGDGAGFSIGFKKEYFFRTDSTDSVKKGDSILLFKIEYEKNDSEQVRSIFNKAQSIYPNWNKKSVDVARPFLAALTSNLLTLLPCIKNIDYHDEHEWRLCMTRLYHEKSNEWVPMAPPMERLIISRRDTSSAPPFLKDLKTSIPRFKSREFKYSDIESIYIGPRLDFITAKLAIEKILLDEGISSSELKNILIRRSERAYQ
jgi:hypothetical protein